MDYTARHRVPIAFIIFPALVMTMIVPFAFSIIYYAVSKIRFTVKLERGKERSENFRYVEVKR